MYSAVLRWTTRTFKRRLQAGFSCHQTVPASFLIGAAEVQTLGRSQGVAFRFSQQLNDSPGLGTLVVFI